MGSITTSSRKIVDMIGVIDGIAFQINILALNAAVEAARAGAQGRGKRPAARVGTGVTAHRPSAGRQLTPARATPTRRYQAVGPAAA